ncbi:hypothetical protein KFK09_013396 [Dendrobium nobile]|uniref:Uncharacterized protein n=1 Tax=Dendrobium nobile TaxID=94219 RepID=A0A8T3B8N0_DENNO|nr:hypothetical protein KFK09_013396 [Dendrobium nobile]
MEDGAMNWKQENVDLDLLDVDVFDGVYGGRSRFTKLKTQQEDSNITKAKPVATHSPNKSNGSGHPRFLLWTGVHVRSTSEISNVMT